MSILLDLRQAVIHKVHNQDEEELRSMIEGSVDGLKLPAGTRCNV